MASARKQYGRTKPAHIAGPPHERAEKTCFINDVLDGTIQATTVETIRAGNGKFLRLEYDDPDGRPGAGQGGAGTRGDNRPPTREEPTT